MATTTDSHDQADDGTDTNDRHMEGVERLPTLWVFLCMVGGIAPTSRVRSTA